jgi:hypothetical protein
MTAQRTVIIGGPRSGKTTEAIQDGRLPVHLDDLIAHCDWSGQSEVAADLLNTTGPGVMEGVAAVRALRKWIERHPEGKPCDHVLYLQTMDVRPEHKRMTAQCATIFAGIAAELVRRGVMIEIVMRGPK